MMLVDCHRNQMVPASPERVQYGPGGTIVVEAIPQLVGLNGALAVVGRHRSWDPAGTASGSGLVRPRLVALRAPVRFF